MSQPVDLVRYREQVRLAFRNSFVFIQEQGGYDEVWKFLRAEVDELWRYIRHVEAGEMLRKYRDPEPDATSPPTGEKP